MPDLRAALSQMTDVAQEVLGEGADQGSLRDFYLALRLRVDYDPSTRIASATVTLSGKMDPGGPGCTPLLRIGALQERTKVVPDNDPGTKSEPGMSDPG